MRIVFMGTPEFAVPPLHYLIVNGHSVVAVYTPPDKPSGRGRALAEPPVKRAALSLNLPVVQIPNLKKAETIAQLAALQPEAIVVAALGQILPQAVLDIPCYGCINIHPALLPRHRGASPIAAAILAGDEFTGVSIMRMDAGLDTGPVFTQARIPISEQDTTASLTNKLSQVAARVLAEVLVALERNELTPQPQNEAEASYSGEIAREQGKIDWQLPAADIWRRVRAYQPWPGCYTAWQDKQLKIIEAVPLPEEGEVKAGQVVALAAQQASGAAFGIGTGKGLLGILNVQLEGKRVVSAAEFLRGQRDFIGATLDD